MADKKISELTNITGSTIADADEFVVVDASAGETKAITASELRTAIGNGDFTVTGNLTVQGTTITVDSASAQNIVLGDNDKMTFGAGSDLQIYHDGFNSIISDQGTGHIKIYANDFRVTNAANTEQMITANQDGAVTLYYDSEDKLATTATGVNITGTLTSDGLTVDGTSAIELVSDKTVTTPHTDYNLLLDNKSDTEFVIRLDSVFSGSIGSSHIKQISEGTNRGALVFATENGSGGTVPDRLKIDYNGDISFYEDSGTTPKFVWKSADERLGIGTDSPETSLHIFQTSASAILRLHRSGATNAADAELGQVEFFNADGSNDGPNVVAKIVGSTHGTSGSGGNLRFFTHDGTEGGEGSDPVERLKIDGIGNVGIGTASPATKLDVQGTTTTNGLNLDAIAETIADTAVDIFVYDTRKDSDGGAWRKRTQGTSWYNETLNTATRGSRKEFPAVAVIVADSTAAETYIYDGDDPDLPLWMSFDNSANSILRSHGSGMKLAMLNGKLMIGLAPNDAGMAEIDFISDGAFRHTTSGSFANKGNYKGNIAERNSGKGFDGIVDNPIVNIFVNDVAMTVLPNAPIDAATGLPAVTTAVATDGGVSVIKDDGTVYDYTSTHGGTAASDYVTFDPVTHAIYFTTDYGGSGDAYKINAKPIPTSDAALGISTYTSFQNFDGDIQSGGNLTVPHLINGGSVSDATDINGLQSTGEAQLAIAEGVGLSQLYEDRAGLTDSLIAYTTSDYATGWMNGNIKLATLSDTDDTDVTGSELVTNGTFDTDVSGWSAGNSATLSLDTNRLKIQSGSAYSYAYQTMTVVVGKTYTVSADLVSGNTNARLRVGTGPNSTAYLNGDILWGPSVHTHTFTATSTSLTITLLNQDADGTDYTIWDNISVRLAEEDRSVNGNGLQVFGTVTKNPVATGADLMAYSDFNASNYLQQPYNSDLDFGTGDFIYMGWFNPSGTTGTRGMFARQTYQQASGNRIQVQIAGSTNEVSLFTGGFSNNTGVLLPVNTWTHFAFVRRNGWAYIYKNGVLEFSDDDATNYDNSTATLLLGRLNFPEVYPFTGSISLFRISATAPSPEQIKKIYEDEKVLFQENAQATLYGSSDAVTALAYDDSTNLLHVGTSAGRSVFQGLRRVDNTTTAVGAAISASNGLVADE